MNTLLYISIIMISGLLCGRLVKLIKLPNVTGYLLAGLIIGPHILKIIPQTIVDDMSLVSEIALAFIAFTVGCSFKMSYFKRVGATPIVIAIFEAMIAVFLVQICLIAVGCSVPYSLVLGAIAAATAPAATIMVIKQYNAKGPVTETLLSVVAIDDAVALVAFGFAVTIAKSLMGNGNQNVVLSILKPFGEVLLALAIGAVCGVLLKLPLKYFKKRSNRTIITVAATLLTSGIASAFNVSALLACMTCGAVFCNITQNSENIASIADDITPPIFVMFFVVSGAGLNPEVIPKVGIAGVVYVVVRVIGKMFGATLGAVIMKTDKTVKKYLGPTLLPQAGVAIGLSLVAQTTVPEFANEIRAIILCGTLIYEIIGPVVTKLSLKAAGEIKE